MSIDSSSLYIFGLITAFSGIINGVFSYKIMHYLSTHGIKVNYWMVRLYILKYLIQYRKLTIEQNGTPGNLFSAWIVSISLFLISVIILIVMLTTGN